MPQSSPTPLADLHRQAQAEFQAWGDVQIVQTFGEPQAEYAAVRKSAGLMDLPQRGILELTGPDRLPFLNNLLTNQTWNKSTKAGIPAGSGVYAFLLNRQGRVVADMNVLELGERTLLETDVRLVEPLRDVLEKYLFAEKVTITSMLGRLHEIALHGSLAGQVLGVTLDAPLRCKSHRLFDVDVIVWRDDPAGVPGYHIILPIESAATVWMKLVTEFGESRELGKRKLRPIGWAAFNSTRIEAGRPVLGIDFDTAPVATAAPGKQPDAAASGCLPAETGLLDRAVSFTKGCYLGQEIVARMQSRQQVARQIVGIRMSDDALPIAGSQVLDEQSNPVGVITSSTISPVLSNAAICLAMVKKSHAAQGAALQIPAEGAIHRGTVVPLPFINSGQGT